MRGNAIAWIALFVALSGTTYAATALPKNSVGTKQLRRYAVTGPKVKKNSLTGANIDESRLGEVPKAIISQDAVTLAGNAPSAFLGAGATATNADKLDGIDSSVFGNKIVVAGSNFEPRNSGSVEKTYNSTGSIYCTGSPVDFQYRVQLPQGASIQGIDYRYLDNDAGTNSSAALYVFNSLDGTGSASDEIATASTTGASLANRTASAEPGTPHIVDNNKYSYELLWSPFACAANMQIRGVAVRYTLPG
jgi:hypothetical protein